MKYHTIYMDIAHILITRSRREWIMLLLIRLQQKNLTSFHVDPRDGASCYSDRLCVGMLGIVVLVDTVRSPEGVAVSIACDVRGLAHLARYSQ